MKWLWWFVPLAGVALVLFTLLRWPLINDVATGQTPEYPDIQPQHLSASPQAAFQACLELARESGWEIVEEQASAGRIEAVASTRVLGFKDDVSIQVQPQEGDASLVHMHSRSRLGRGDFGTNARRIRAFQQALATRLD
ncbi:MAG: DUF1499 domain-containing protein [Thioalkalivibrio sp.]